MYTQIYKYRDVISIRAIDTIHTMTIVLIIETNGTVKELAMKQYVEADLYKRAGFKTPDGFQQHGTFSMKTIPDTFKVKLYGKITGKANRENKYEFPPPVDNTLFFGSCLLIALSDTDVPIDLTKGMWETLYTKLYGGFDSLVEVGGEDADAAEEAEALRRDRAESLELGHTLTKQGYAKDGFIVDDSTEENDSDEVEDTEEEDEDTAYFDDKSAPQTSHKVGSDTIASESIPIVDPMVVVDTPIPAKKPLPKRTPVARVAKPKGGVTSERRSKRSTEPVNPTMAFTDQDNLTEEAYL